MDDSDIAKAAIRGVANPAIAIGTAITLYNVAIRKFYVMRFCDAFANGIKPTSWSRFSPKNTMSDALRAASNALDGEIETCASQSAAVSFKPSPIIRTR